MTLPFKELWESQPLRLWEESLSSHLRRQQLNVSCQGVGETRGKEELVVFDSTNITSVWGFFSPSFPERQLSNSCKGVKPNLYFCADCNTGVLNKEEQINVWPSLRVPQLRVQDDRSGDPALVADQCACSWGVSPRNHRFRGCPLPQLGIRKVRDKSRCEVPHHAFYKAGRYRIWKPGQYPWGEKPEGTLHPYTLIICAILLNFLVTFSNLQLW